MARRKFTPDPDFQLIVSEAALGRDARGGRGPVSGQALGRTNRRRRTTIQSIAEDIIQQAKDIVDDEVVGLPSVSKGGGRNIGYEFRSEDRHGKTYRASFSSEVEFENGRFVIVVRNTHDHAQDIEFGNANGSVHEVGPSSTGKGYFPLPITEVAYAKIRRKMKANRKPLTQQQREYQNIVQRKRYYENRAVKIKKLENPRKGTGDKKRAQQQLRAVEMTRRSSARRANEALSEYLQAKRPKHEPHAFIGRHRTTNKPILFTRSFQTYGAYGILQRAIRNIARHRF